MAVPAIVAAASIAQINVGAGQSIFESRYSKLRDKYCSFSFRNMTPPTRSNCTFEEDYPRLVRIVPDKILTTLDLAINTTISRRQFHSSHEEWATCAIESLRLALPECRWRVLALCRQFNRVLKFSHGTKQTANDYLRRRP